MSAGLEDSRPAAIGVVGETSGSNPYESRSSRAVVIVESPNTLGHSPKARLVVTTIEVLS
jgi:hypothetical protein